MLFRSLLLLALPFTLLTGCGDKDEEGDSGHEDHEDHDHCDGDYCDDCGEELIHRGEIITCFDCQEEQERWLAEEEEDDDDDD